MAQIAETATSSLPSPVKSPAATAQPALGVAGLAVHPEAAVAEAGEVDVALGGLAEHDVGRARVALADLRQPAGAAGGADRAEHEVAAAVAVDVARGHGVARAVAFAGAVDAEALRVGREVDLGRRGAAVDDARATGVRLGGRARIGPRGADQQVVLAVAVDVADAGQRPAERGRSATAPSMRTPLVPRAARSTDAPCDALP